MLRGPWLTSLTHKRHKEMENKWQEGEEREERGFTHSSMHFLHLHQCRRKQSGGGLEAREREHEDRKGGERKEGCEEKEVEEQSIH